MNRFQQFLYGRNGFDQIAITSLALALMVLIIAGITGLTPLAFLYLALILYALFRVMSTDVHGRRRENIKFLSAVNAVVTPIRLRYRMVKERKTHKYLRCPSCRCWLRLPKGRGRIAISCSKCRNSFIETV